MVPYRLSFGDTADGALADLEYIMDCYFILDLGIIYIRKYLNDGL